MSIPSYKIINSQAKRCFVFKWEEFDLGTPWHFHPEIELIYFVHGQTTGVIGEGFHEFNEGDLVLLGSGFPHVLKVHLGYARHHPETNPFGLIIQFTEDFLGKDFFNVPELRAVKQFFGQAKRGIIFGKKLVESLSGKLLEMHRLDDTHKLICILDILVILTTSDDFRFLTPENYTCEDAHDEERIRNINQYIYKHFNDPISISDIASVSNMTETSFCRYFKMKTNKNFVRFLNEIRISYACKLLNSKSYSITDACYESGFNSLSYFIRQFKSIMKMSPREYKSWKNKALNS